MGRPDELEIVSEPFFETIFETGSDPSAVYRLVIIVWYLPGWNRVPKLKT
jgi:hypothetical protein